MTAIDDRKAEPLVSEALTFEQVLQDGLRQDAKLCALSEEVRLKLADLSTFVGATDAREAYKTLKSWPTTIPMSMSKQPFQKAIDEAVDYLERWLCNSTAQSKLIKLIQD